MELTLIKLWVAVERWVGNVSLLLQRLGRNPCFGAVCTSKLNSRESSMPVRIVQLEHTIRCSFFKITEKRKALHLPFLNQSSWRNIQYNVDVLHKAYLYSFSNPLKIFLNHLEPFRSYFLEVTIWLENKVESLECKYSISNSFAIWNLVSELWVTD